ncbi:MAG: AMP-binding protein [Proteobacteria bacterium]|nr:AMP-binding protein [Pseudomonadota bacterium]
MTRAADLNVEGAGIRFLDLKENETWLGWSEIATRAARAAGTLREAGVREGQRVAMAIPTSPLFLDAFFGTLWLGATPVPLYPPVRLGRLDEYIAKTARMIQIVGATALIADKRTRRVLGQVVARTDVPMVLAEDLASGAERPAHMTLSEDYGLVQFSSGTTTDPKPVALTHRALLANTESILDFMPDGAEIPHAGVSWLPLYHDMGLIGCIFPALHRPGTLTLIPPEMFLLKPALWLRAISKYRATVSPAPNFAYAYATERILDKELEGVDLSSWTLALNGAEPITEETLAGFTKRFATHGFAPTAMTPVYGLSEAALAVTFSPPGRGPKITAVSRSELAAGRFTPASDGVSLVSVGLPLRGFTVEIRVDDQPVEPGVVGHLFVQGPSLLSRYLGRDEQPLVDGWLDTGDLAALHEGELYIVGRAKDIIVIRGRNHHPADIETAVDGVEGVRTGCVAAVGDVTEHGEELVVFIEVREAIEGLAEACAQAIRSRSGVNPGLVVLLEPGSLPRTSSGKLRRSEALKRFKDGVLLPPSRVGPLYLAGALAKSALGYWGRKL